MIGFVCASTLLLAAGLALAPLAGKRQRRLLEGAALLAAVLPLLSRLAPAAWVEGVLPMIPGGETPASDDGLRLLWLAGFGVGLLRLAFSWRALQRWRQDSARLDAEDSVRIARLLGLSADEADRRFRVSADDRGPALLPGLPGRILLPCDWRRWPVRWQAAALRHEWHHLRRGDAWWHLLLSLFAVALWWQPLAWLLRRRWRQESERLADLAACVEMPPEDYAVGLLRLASDGGRHAVPSLAAAFAGVSPLRRRLALLLRGGRRDHRGLIWLIGGLALLTILAVLSAGWLQQRGETRLLRREAALRLAAEAFPADR